MIKIDDKKLTPKQAAKLIIKDGLEQSLNHWDGDTEPGQQLARVMTEREWRLVNDQIIKIWRRIDKSLEQGEQA